MNTLVPLVAEGSEVLTALTTATAGFKTELMAIGGVAIGIAAGVFLLRKGWGLIRSFVK